MASHRQLQQARDLQMRVAELSAQHRLDLLTDGEVALVCYALGRYTAELMAPLPVPVPPTPRAERAKAKPKVGRR